MATNGLPSDCVLSKDTLNPKLVAAEYAVRGYIAQKAEQYRKELAEGKTDLPFTQVTSCNIGNPQALGQKPITFFRQVLCLMDYPELMDSEHAARLFPADVIARAKDYLAHLPGGIGAYSDSKGAPYLRQQVAAGIERRDGFPCDPDSLFMTDGASPGVHLLCKLLLRDEHDAILTPIPQYPLYSAAITVHGGTLLPYYLSEEHGWAANLSDMHDQVQQARSEGKCVRALVVINPGNPTGQVLDKQVLVDIVKFCKREHLILIADEVYQTNVYAEGKQFHSMKKVLKELGPSYDDVPLGSLNSISKGYFGECGRRGGYIECINFPAEVKEQMVKYASINLCSNLSGQVCAALTLNPPQPGEPSYALFAEERDAILESLKRRALLVVDAFANMEGVSCNPAEGAMYVFPRLRLPQGALEEAKKQGKPADFLYCVELLDKTGIVTVPGSGFRQEEGTLHLRTTILPPETDMERVARDFQEFHKEYMARYT
ncbi:hypothetical protein N2152v2_009576 [Parachlorella kessleri]